MWSNVISIDKGYDREIAYILKSLQHTKDVSSAVEESKGRMWMYLASSCDRQDCVEQDMLDIMKEVYLSFIKLRFFNSKLKLRNMTHAKCALISSIVHFDREFEGNIVSKAISTTLDYNVDGLLNFRMRALKDSWQEIADVANRLLDNSTCEEDIYDVASFITGSEGKKTQLAVKDGKIYSLAKREHINVLKVFDNEEYNTLFALIRQKPSEILIENTCFSANMLNTLKHIARTVEK